jgi:hypothetical protein
MTYNIKHLPTDRYVSATNPIALSSSQAIAYKDRHSAETAHQRISQLHGDRFRIVERSPQLKLFTTPLLISGGCMALICVFFMETARRSQSATPPPPPIVALPRTVPTPITPAPSNIVPMVQSREVLQMVMVDQAQLSATQRTEFQQYIQTANLPHTKVGKRCQYYGKPDVWCLILDAPVANQVVQQLSKQSFSSKVEVKPVRRLKAPEKN